MVEAHETEKSQQTDAPQTSDETPQGEQEKLELQKPAQRNIDAPLHSIKRVQYVPRFANQYKRGLAGFEIHVRIRPSLDDGNAQYFIARLWRVAGVGLNKGPFPIRFWSKAAIGENQTWPPVDLRLIRRARRYMNCPVLIDVIEPSEASEMLEGVPMPSGPVDGTKVERLEVFELVSVGGFHVCPIDMEGPLVFVGADGELDLPDNCRVSRLDTIEIAQGKLPREMVESAPKIVPGISHDETPVIADLYAGLDAEYDCAPFWLELPPDGQHYSVGILFDANLGPKRFNVFARPFELCPRA